MRILLISMILSLILAVNPAVAAKPKKAKARKTRLYLAAALFNGREVRFNQDLASRLEGMGYRVVLPQRDGFEYVTLRKTIQDKAVKDKAVKDKAVVNMTRDLIYLLDMGVFIPQSDIVVANLDEPLDPGVIVELTYAHLMGKHVIGFRTDTRTPFPKQDGSLGMHSFVALQCDEIIKLKIPDQNVHDASAAMQTLAKKISKLAKKVDVSGPPAFSKSALDNPVISKLLHASRLVFNDVHGIHSDKGLKKVIANYQNNHKLIQQLAIPETNKV